MNELPECRDAFLGFLGWSWATTISSGYKWWMMPAGLASLKMAYL
jgi:hypothetical protein